jgi:hypothetical protein
LLTTAPPVLQQPAQTSNGFSNSSSTLYANGFPRTDSSSSSSWQSQRRWLTRQVTDADRCVIRDKGLTAWPGWAELQQAWPQLQQQWDEATQQLPAAIERLLAVSRSGPVKVVVFDIESTACKCCVVSAHLRIRDCRWDCFFKLAQKHLHGWQPLLISYQLGLCFAHHSLYVNTCRLQQVCRRLCMRAFCTSISRLGRRFMGFVPAAQCSNASSTHCNDAPCLWLLLLLLLLLLLWPYSNEP